MSKYVIPVAPKRPEEMTVADHLKQIPQANTRIGDITESGAQDSLMRHCKQEYERMTRLMGESK
jgi:hypothetical protein